MKGITPENSHVVFCPNHLHSFEPFMCLDLSSKGSLASQKHSLGEVCSTRENAQQVKSPAGYCQTSNSQKGNHSLSDVMIIMSQGNKK